MLACSIGSSTQLRPIACDSFGAALFSLRSQRAISQLELSVRIGRARSYVSEIENGRVPAPRGDVVDAIARALGLADEEHQSLLQQARAEREQAVRFGPTTTAGARQVAWRLKQVGDRLRPDQVQRLLSILEESKPMQ